MKKNFSTKVLGAIFAFLPMTAVLASCGAEPHVCEHVCEICNGCTDAACQEDECATKCPTHTLTAPVLSLNGNVISWSGVNNASGYEVFVNDTSKGVQATLSYTIADTLVGSYVVKVMAKGNGSYIVNSPKSNGVTYTINPTKLTAPAISLDGNTIMWSAVANATSYNVYMDNALKANVTTTSYAITETTVGTYKFKVSAKPTSNQYVESDKSNEVTFTVSPTQLAAPALTLNGNVVSWNAVANAASYDVYVNSILKGNQTDTSYTIAETALGNYVVEVMAKAGSNQFVDSVKSSSVTYTIEAQQLAAPVVTLSGNVASWTAVANAASYDVYVNNALKGNQTTTSYTVSETNVGDYVVEVMAKAGSELFLDSAKSTPVTYSIQATQLAAPVITLTGKTISWTAVADAAKYEVTVDGVKAGDTTEASYVINGVSLGAHTVSIKALPAENDANHLTSAASNEVSYTAKLDETPVILSIQACGDIMYDPQLGCLRQATATDTEADKAVQFVPIQGDDGYYNIKTTSGLYLWAPSDYQYWQRARTLARPDIPDQYVTPLAAWKLCDIATATPNLYFHLYNKGVYDTVNSVEVGLAGSPTNNEINLWASALDVWTTIQVRTANATIAATGTLTSGTDFSKKSIAYFYGSEDTFGYDTTNNYYVAGKDISEMTAQEKEEASWTFEDAGNGRYYIKTGDGCYMKAYLEGPTCYMTKVSASEEKTANFEFYFMSRGGNFYSMSNFGLETDCASYLYAWNTALATFNVRWQQSCAFIIRIENI